MVFTAFFSVAGVPETGLTVTIDIWNLGTNTKVVDAAGCTEVGGGFYKYDYTSYDSDIDYGAIFDGGVALDDIYRYKYAGNITNYPEQLLLRTLGLSFENYYIDTTVYSSGKLTSARIRIYSVAGSVGTDNDVSATYELIATYSGNDLSTYKIEKV